MVKYDFLVVGSGLFGAVFTERAQSAGKSCLVIEKRAHIGGNVYTENINGIEVHRYGAHIFHTDNRDIWEYVNHFAEFNSFINSPLANYKEKIYNLPFNMNTFNQMWGVTSPDEAKKLIAAQIRSHFTPDPSNLEEQAINLVGTDIYKKLIKEYTEKQWGRPCRELPPEIIKRLPVRFMYDNNYFNSQYQGIPKNGYTDMIRNMLGKAEIEFNTDYLKNREYWDRQANLTLYTGAADAFYGYRFGALEYRSLRFETEELQTDNYQGNAVINFTDALTPYTRIIEHKHFMPDAPVIPHTIISREYSLTWKIGEEAYYPIGDTKNLSIYAKYKALMENEERVLFGGRLASYQYLDMDKTVENAIVLRSVNTP